MTRKDLELSGLSRMPSFFYWLVKLALLFAQNTKFNFIASSLAVVVFSSSFPLFAQTTNHEAPKELRITTIDGSTFTGVRIRKITASHIVFSHSAGFATINVNELTDESKSLLGVTNTIDEFITTHPPPVPTRLGSFKICPSCRGLGIIVCPKCSGGGFGVNEIVKEQCDQCGGRGWIRKEIQQPVPDYYYPYGSTGKRRVYRTEITNVDCPKCKGSGQIEKKIRRYCDKCGGHKYIRCPACSR